MSPEIALLLMFGLAIVVAAIGFSFLWVLGKFINFAAKKIKDNNEIRRAN